jgi:hypothetical protein
MSLIVWVDESDEFFQTRSEDPGTSIHKERLKIARGLKGTFYTFEIRNESGSDFDLAGLHIMVEALRRRGR